MVLIEGAVFCLSLWLLVLVAIDGVLADSYHGLMILAGLCFVMKVTGSMRGLYHTRVFGGRHRQVRGELVQKEKRGGVMGLWEVVGSFILLWVVYDLLAGVVWIHRRVERGQEALLYWISMLCYTLLGLWCFVPYG